MNSYKNSNQTRGLAIEIEDSPNRLTLDAYSKRFLEFIQSVRPHHPALLRWIDSALILLPQNGKILEVGSATPRDARYMRSQGYRVQCSDAVVGFVNYLRSQGEDALLLDIINDPIYGTYDMVFANAVVQHFTNNELQRVAEKVRDSLPSGGVFAFSVKQGNGNVWINEKFNEKRYIHYWQPGVIRSLLEDAGYDITFMESGVQGDLPGHVWINITAQKP